MCKKYTTPNATLFSLKSYFKAKRLLLQMYFLSTSLYYGRCTILINLIILPFENDLYKLKK